MEATIQQQLAHFIVDCRYEKITENCITDMKYRIMDWLGCAITGVHYPQVNISRHYFTETKGCEEATILGAPGKYPLASAVMVNGIIGHVSELDDGHRQAIGHPGSVTLPVALALAEKLNANSHDVLKALILGYDLFIRLGRTVNPSHYAMWHTTGTCGAFAATATAASLMKLTPEQTSNALGIVATLTSGLLTSFGTHAKALNIGHACQNAIYAASLAKQGFTGSQQAITGEKGFIHAMSSEPQKPFLDALCEENLCSDSAFYKVYASCGHTNSPLDVTFRLLKNPVIDYKNIINIRVETYQTAVSLTGKLQTENEDQAKFSLPYCIAVAMIYGQVSLAQFKPEILNNSDVQALAKKIDVIASAEATARFPKRQAKVTITLNDGKVYSDSVSDASDEVHFDVIENKFLSAAKGIDQHATKQIMRYLKTLDKQVEMKPLFDYLKLIGAPHPV